MGTIPGEYGRHVRIEHRRGRVKERTLRQSPRVALSIQDPQNPYRSLQVRGRVAEMTERGADEHIAALARKCLGQDRYPYRQPGEVRVMVRIEPERAQGMG
ncbi:MAG TPA: PPOX class F420-dependent oxidoreductase [Methylomirabilota bacterium]|nr:PPOX class F420-dependent oxidoreductase [Methylomirabilota bacterium]